MAISTDIVFVPDTMVFGKQEETTAIIKFVIYFLFYTINESYDCYLRAIFFCAIHSYIRIF